MIYLGIYLGLCWGIVIKELLTIEKLSIFEIFILLWAILLSPIWIPVVLIYLLLGKI